MKKEIDMLQIEIQQLINKCIILNKDEMTAVVRVTLGRDIELRFIKILQENKQLKKENELKDKAIKLMAEYIESKKTLVDKYYNVLTAGTIKKYFENKAKESEE